MRTADVKDQIELSGNDIQAVSMTGERSEEFTHMHHCRCKNLIVFKTFDSKGFSCRHRTIPRFAT